MFIVYAIDGDISFQYIQCWGSSEATALVLSGILEFQYIQCWGSSRLNGNKSLTNKYVSIHPMLRFIAPCNRTSKTWLQVSIHPMLRFIHAINKWLFRTTTVSIHPMLRFIWIMYPAPKWAALCFNTSNVEVHHIYYLHFSSLPDCFNTSNVEVHPLNLPEFSIFLSCFNTSNVEVHLMYY